MKEYVLDCLDEACPVPLIKAQAKLEELEVEDVLTVNVNYSCAVKNIPEWCRNVGYNCEVVEVEEGVWDIVIEKSK